MAEIFGPNGQYRKNRDYNRRRRIKDKQRELAKRQPRWLFDLDGDDEIVLPSLDSLVHVTVEKVTIPASRDEKGAYRISPKNWNYVDAHYRMPDIITRYENTRNKTYGRTVYVHSVKAGWRTVRAVCDEPLLKTGDHRRLDVLAAIGHMETGDPYYPTIEDAIYKPTRWLISRHPLATHGVRPFEYEYVHNKPHQRRARKVKRDFWKWRRDDVNRKVESVKMRKINIDPESWESYY